MSTSKSELKQTHPKTRQAWRKWLEKNHTNESGVWFVYFKKETGKPRVSYEEAVEEALCFGWIDSLPRKLDEERTSLKFTPRKPTSVWSEINKKRITELIKSKKMTAAGMVKVELAKKNGSWDHLTNSDQHTTNNTLPADLENALKKKQIAFKNFNAFASSYRKRFLSWIDSAKTAETRQVRVKQTVLMSAANKKPDAAGFKL